MTASPGHVAASGLQDEIDRLQCFTIRVTVSPQRYGDMDSILGQGYAHRALQAPRLPDIRLSGALCVTAWIGRP